MRGPALTAALRNEPSNALAPAATPINPPVPRWQISVSPCAAGPPVMCDHEGPVPSTGQPFAKSIHCHVCVMQQAKARHHRSSFRHMKETKPRTGLAFRRGGGHGRAPCGPSLPPASPRPPTRKALRKITKTVKNSAWWPPPAVPAEIHGGGLALVRAGARGKSSPGGRSRGLPRAPPARPRPLKIIPAQPPRHIHRLANHEQPRHRIGHHRLG